MKMIGMMRVLLLALATPAVASPWETLLTTASLERLKAQNHGEALVDWLVSEGGFFSPKLEIRRNASDSYGIFASQVIEEDEILIKIPSDAVLFSDPVQQGDAVVVLDQHGREVTGIVVQIEDDGDAEVRLPDLEHEIYEYESLVHFEICGIARTLTREFRNGETSQYAPYIRYLQSQPVGILPSTWSRNGKRMLLEVLGTELPPEKATTLIQDDWIEVCEGENDPLQNHAFAIAVQLGYHKALIPVLDLLRHRNGDHLNSEYIWDDVIVLKATKRIDVGQEVFTSVNQCSECDTRRLSFGTPEILRDYGFVEDYPQRWIFSEHHIGFDVDLDDDDELVVQWIKEYKKPKTRGWLFLRQQLYRLEYMDKTDLANFDPDVPEREWNIIKKFITSAILALKAAMKDAPTKDCDEGVCHVALDHRYNALEPHVEVWSIYRPETCDFWKAFHIREWDHMENIYSHYQHIRFGYNPWYDDTCFELDLVQQICQSYRPHYHEMAVHGTAQFLDSVKRVLFVGGGDSMLLHDVLKYDTLELVVGLELDQDVTRSSFKYFGSQPHWDDERVEWWFGDATKSLLMLPKNYFGSFDMVLVDLSETVMALSVTEGLDVMQALTLLVKPSGIVLKNENGYFASQSKLFKHNFHFHYYNVTSVCSQSLVISSNGVDFLRDPVKAHNVDHLHYLLDSDNMRYELGRDYQRNDTVAKFFCRDPAVSTEPVPTQQIKSPGILFIVEVEGATINLKDPNKVVNALTSGSKKAGLKVLTTKSDRFNETGVAAFVILKEGYIVARTWPNSQYCALDIHLWGRFDKHKATKNAIIVALGGTVEGKSSSAYRIVAGGMFGVDSWQVDEKNRGPHVTEVCSTDSDVSPRKLDVTETDSSYVKKVLSELVELGAAQAHHVAVLCPSDGDCWTEQVAKETATKTGSAVVKLVCPALSAGIEFSEDGDRRMFACEESLLFTLSSLSAGGGKIGTIVLDSGAGYALAQVANRLFDNRIHSRRWLAGNVTIVGAALDAKDPWRHEFVDQFRRTILPDEPVFGATLEFHTDSITFFEVFVVQSGDPFFVEGLAGTMDRLDQVPGLSGHIVKVRAGDFTYQAPFLPDIVYKHEDFNLTDPLDQWRSQRPVGAHLLYQYEVPLTTSIDKEKLALALKRAMQKLPTALETLQTPPELVVLDTVGEGVVMSVLWKEGTVVVLWDGRQHVDVSLFSIHEAFDKFKSFEQSFRSQFEGMTLALFDQQPRGSGRVVVFHKDWTPHPHWEPGYSLGTPLEEVRFLPRL